MVTYSSGPRQADIEPSPITQKPNVTRRVAANSTEDDHLLLPPLEPVNRLDLDSSQIASPSLAQDGVVPVGSLGSRIWVEELVDQPDLSGVGGDDADILAAHILPHIRKMLPNVEIYDQPDCSPEDQLRCRRPFRRPHSWPYSASAGSPDNHGPQR